MIFCINPHYTLDVSNYLSLKLLWQGEGSSKWGYCDYDSCVCLISFFLPQTHAHAHTSIHRILVRADHYIQQSECSFLHLILFIFRLNLLFSCFLYFIHNYIDICMDRNYFGRLFEKLLVICMNRNYFERFLENYWVK